MSRRTAVDRLVPPVSPWVLPAAVGAAAVWPSQALGRDPEPGLYTVFVHNYSAQRDGADGFEMSNARVIVQGQDGEELGRFAVPTTGGGFFWDVLSFQGNDPRTLFPLQQITSRPNPYDEYTKDCRP